MSSVSRKASSWSFNSEKWTNEGKNKPHSAVYAVHVKGELQKGMHQHRGVACCVMLKVGGHKVVYFVTSSGLETDKKQVDLLPCIAQKTEGCQLVVDSTVKFGPFAFLSFDRKSSPGLKGNPLTCLDFQVPKQNLKSEFEARTFVGTKKLLKLKFEYQRNTRKYSFSAKKKDRLEQSFVLGAPIIIKNMDVTDKRSSSRWPVVGVMGLDKDRQFFPYFVTADIFDRKPVHSKGGCLGPGIELNVTAADSRTAHSEGERSVPGDKLTKLNGTATNSRPAQSEGEGSVPGNELNVTATKHVNSASGSEGRGAISQLASTSDSEDESYDKPVNITREAGDLAKEAIAYFNLGLTYESQGDFPKAIECFEKSLKIASEAGDRVTEGKACLNLGLLYDTRKDFPKAIEYYEKRIEIARVEDDRASLGKAYLNLGLVYHSKTEFSKAINCFEKGLMFGKEAGDRATEGKAYLNLGLVYYTLNNNPKAIECFENCLKIAREEGDRATEGQTYFNLGVLYDSQSDVPKAIDCYEESLKSARKAGDWATLGQSYVNAGANYCSQSDFPKAIEYLENGLKFSREAGDQATEGTAYINLAYCYYSKRDFPKAIEWYKEILKIAKEGDDRGTEGMAYLGLGRVYHSQSDFGEATKCYEKSLGIAMEAGDQAGVIRVNAFLQDSYLAHRNSLKDSRPVQREEEQSVPKNELHTTAAGNQSHSIYNRLQSMFGPLLHQFTTREAAVSSPAGATSQRMIEEASVYYDLGMDHISRFDAPKAIDCFERSLGNARKEEEKAALTLGVFYQSESNFPKAIKRYEKSLAIARETGNRAKEGDDCYSLATVYESSSNFPEAIKCYEKSLDIAVKEGDQAREGKANYSLGILYDSLGNSRKASECYEKSFSVTGDAGDRTRDRKACSNLGNAPASHSDLTIELLKASLKVSSEGGFQAGANRANRELAISYFVRGDFTKADTHRREYLKAVNQVGAHTEETAEGRPNSSHVTPSEINPRGPSAMEDIEDKAIPAQEGMKGLAKDESDEEEEEKYPGIRGEENVRSAKDEESQTKLTTLDTTRERPETAISKVTVKKLETKENENFANVTAASNTKPDDGDVQKNPMVTNDDEDTA